LGRTAQVQVGILVAQDQDVNVLRQTDDVLCFLHRLPVNPVQKSYADFFAELESPA
jgi:hypothetical protein